MDIISDVITVTIRFEPDHVMNESLLCKIIGTNYSGCLELLAPRCLEHELELFRTQNPRRFAWH